MANNANLNMNTINLETTETVKKSSVLDPMKQAILVSAEAGNKHPVTAQEAACAGISPDDYSAYRAAVRSLRLAATEYGKVVEKKDSTTEAIALAKGRVADKVSEILTVSADFHRNMFTRPEDVETMRVYAYNLATISIEGIGTIAAVTPERSFFKVFESWLGLRIRANEALNDADRDLIMKYLGAKKAVETAKQRLLGNEDTDGNHKPGLKETLASLQKRYDDALEMLGSFGISLEDAIKNPAMTALDEQKTKVEKDISTAEKQKQDAEKYLDEHKDQYNRILATINKIEGINRK